MILVSRSFLAARRCARVALPCSVMATSTTRPSSGLGSLRTSPASSSLLINWVMAGCVTPSRAASRVSRCGPKRSTAASVAAAVVDRLPAGLSDRNNPTIRSKSAASASASPAGDISLELSIRNLYHMLM
jgi:hypothetical protein